MGSTSSSVQLNGPLMSNGAATATNLFSNSDFGSFSGVNIVAFINNIPVGTLMGVSYTVHSEKTAQYVFGDPNPRRFTTGKRGIAGTLIFNTFDRSALLGVFLSSQNGQLGNSTLADSLTGGDKNKFIETFPQNGSLADATQQPDSLTNAIAYANAGSVNVAGAGAQLNSDIGLAYKNTFLVPLEYADQLPPFDITLSMVDSQGHGAFMILGGIEILNEGGGFSIDDSTNQTSYTYVCRYMRPLTPINPGTGASVLPSVQIGNR